MKKLTTALLALATLTTMASAQDEPYRLRSFGDPNSYINLQFGAPEVSNVDLTWLNTQWKVMRSGGQVALQNAQTGKFLSVINGQVTAADPDPNPRGQGYHVWNQRFDPMSKKISFQHAATKQWLTIGSPDPAARGQLQRRFLTVSATESKASEWMLAEIPVAAAPAPIIGEVARWRNVSNPGLYLNADNGRATASPFNPEWQSEMWEIRRMQRGRFVIVSRSSQKFLIVNDKNQVVMSDPDPARGSDKQPMDGYDVWQTTPTKEGKTALLHPKSGMYLTLSSPVSKGGENVFGLEASSKILPGSAWEIDARFKSDPDGGQFSGLYRYAHYSNPWHEGWITELPDGTATWTNRAGVGWKLIPQQIYDQRTGKRLDGLKDVGRREPVRFLNKEPGSPYQNAPGGQQFELIRNKGGEITGFRFQGEVYSRI